MYINQKASKNQNNQLIVKIGNHLILSGSYVPYISEYN